MASFVFCTSICVVGRWCQDFCHERGRVCVQVASDIPQALHNHWCMLHSSRGMSGSAGPKLDCGSQITCAGGLALPKADHTNSDRACIVGIQVVLTANEGPSINDILATELQELLVQARQMDEHVIG